MNNKNIDNIIKECKKYTPESYGGLNMLFSKETQEVLVKISSLIHECLKCDEFKKGCKDKHELVKFLSSNK